MKVPQKFTILYCDGSSLGNPGPGGYASYLQFFEGGRCMKDQWIQGAFRYTTNNRMELFALLTGLQHIPPDYQNFPIQVFTDSEYLSRAISEGWLERWIRTGKKKVANLDLWKQIADFLWVRGYSMWMVHIPAHRKVLLNELCDYFARMQAEYARKNPERVPADPGYPPQTKQ